MTEVRKRIRFVPGEIRITPDVKGAASIDQVVTAVRKHIVALSKTEGSLPQPHTSEHPGTDRPLFVYTNDKLNSVVVTTESGLS